MNEDEINYNYAALLYRRHLDREEQNRHTWVFDGKNDPFRYGQGPANSLERRILGMVHVEPHEFHAISG